MKTRQQKIISGTYRPDREKSCMNFEPLKTVPEPFEKLSPKSRRYFENVCYCLLNSGALTQADIPIVTRASKIFGQWCDAQADIEKNGTIQRTQSGYSAKTAAWTIAIDCDKQLTSFEKSYGLSLSARQKMDIPQQKDAEPNPFDEL